MKKKTSWILFWVFLILLALDLLIPDPIPIIDEVLLAIVTAWLGIKQVKK